MQKKIIALAIASAISAPAFAANANIEFYGKVNVDVESVQTNNPNGTSKDVQPTYVLTNGTNSSSLTRVATNASRFGLKGKEDLGDGLSAIFQYEVQMDANGAAGNGFGNGTRNSQIGLEDKNLGTVFFGHWDTPFKLAHNKVELFDNTHFASAINLMGRSGATTAVSANAAVAGAKVVTNFPALSADNVTAAADNFNTRQKQVIQYWSPKIAGFDVKLAYGADNAAVGQNSVNSNVSLPLSKSVYSASATFENDDVYVSAAFEGHNDIVSQAATTPAPALKGNNTASRLVGAFKLGHAGFVGLTYESLAITTLVNPAAAAAYTNTLTRSNLELSGSYKLGTQSFGATYAIAGDLGGFADTGATQLSLRYGYSFSKRSELYAMYSSLNNKTYGQYNFSAGNVLAGAAGAKLTGLGVGIAHSF